VYPPFPSTKRSSFFFVSVSGFCRFPLGDGFSRPRDSFAEDLRADGSVFNRLPLIVFDVACFIYLLCEQIPPTPSSIVS